MSSKQDARWLAAAASLAERARPLSRPNPAVGAVVIRDGIVIGRGWTQPGGRPHAEAIALEQAGVKARGATLYVTLEPCAHQSDRGPACADLVAAAGVARVVAGVVDPDQRTSGAGLERLRAAGIDATCADDETCRESLAGFLMRKTLDRPHVTLKLAMSLDGCIATASGESQWITGPEARAHAHRERARVDAILVGGGTFRADAPKLDVRLPGLEARSPARLALTGEEVPDGWHSLIDPQEIRALEPVQYLLVEGGAGAAASFLEADLVDRLMIYRGPVLLGPGLQAIGDIGLESLADAHARWRHVDRRLLGRDTLDIYQRSREARGWIV
ncbi:bifunctional diaminohydroxyphosphoribosylaminopyrimidine deaminase/5-amino-6-(5-phosphoribosylamino)uracil reductase RibD [Altererythrobacter sp. Root672]|uniref:bifunctional diaminohydroxyphosphoribosylaminopyrimidine deaminase/5-amino-6-(5-phosphoribosylamino)uracil reductase RibD n=1 Tax=Altererythrobacter sp. Root672 TaxID=1736584 RepID=UPI000A8782C8|nr:bifunctional diaminohydroxyphosphoribosylaminopyrimidine deaminase/5-amino-6-(5-phosphoribosylamino)uracil reductase RibD [Altererythrobacter sp. Root672]